MTEYSGFTKTEYFLTDEGNRALWKRKDIAVDCLCGYFMAL